jgi:hypothetical protein
MEGRFIVMNRGNWRENIFWDEVDRERFRGTPVRFAARRNMKFMRIVLCAITFI